MHLKSQDSREPTVSQALELQIKASTENSLLSCIRCRRRRTTNRVLEAIAGVQVGRQLLVASCLKWHCHRVEAFYFCIDEVDELLLLLRKIKHSADSPTPHYYALVVESVDLLTNNAALKKEVFYLLRQIANEYSVPIYYIELVQECMQPYDLDIFDVTISVDVNN